MGFRCCDDIRGPWRRVEEDTATAVARCCASCVTVRGERFPHIVAGHVPSSACRFRFSSRWQKRPGGYSTSSREGQRWLSLITFRTRSGAGMGEVKSPKEGLTRTRCPKWTSSRRTRCRNVGIDGPMPRVKLGMENQGEGAGDQRRGILVRTRRESPCVV